MLNDVEYFRCECGELFRLFYDNSADRVVFRCTKCPYKVMTMKVLAEPSAFVVQGELWYDPKRKQVGLFTGREVVWAKVLHARKHIKEFRVPRKSLVSKWF